VTGPAAPTGPRAGEGGSVDALGGLAHLFTEIEEVERAVESAAVEGMRLFGAQRAAVCLFSRDGRSAECRIAIGLSARFVQALATRGRERAPVQPLIVEDLAHGPDDPFQAEALAEGIGASICLPLGFGGEIIGMLSYYHDRPRRSSPEEAGVARAFAAVTSLAIGQTRLLDQVTRIKREWQSAFDGTGNGMALVDASGHIARGNRYLAELAGVPVTSLPGLNLRTLFPGWPDPAGDPILLAIAGQVRVSLPLESRDGRHLAITATPRPTGGLVIVVEDLTTLVRLEERFTRLVQTADDGIVIADLEGRVVFANRAACELFDRTAAELQGQRLDDLLPPDQPGASSPSVPSPLSGRPAAARYAASVAHVQGTRYAAVSRAPLEERGIRTGTVAVIREVTRDRLASEALRRSEARFRALFAAVPLAIFTVTRDYRFQSVNHAAVLLAELGRRDAGRRVGDFILPDQAEAVEAHLAASFRGETRNFTFHVRRLDGETREAAAVAVAYEAEEGERAVLLIARDVTDEIRLRERVTHAEKLAALGQLVSGVAHELNNPLAGIAALSQALSLDPAAAGEPAEIADAIRREAVRAANIVGDLLTFARQRPLRRGPVDLNALVAETVDATARAREGGTTWRLELAPGLPVVDADPDQLRQVITNLLTNGAHSMADKGGGTGTVRTWWDDRVVGCEVADSGVGLPPELLPRIFEPFFTTKPVGQGTGLGLSISHGIIRAHGGEILATTRPEGGAAFRFELPRSSIKA
jgi:PAS domain S-box-containing protein